MTIPIDVVPEQRQWRMEIAKVHLKINSMYKNQI